MRKIQHYKLIRESYEPDEDEPKIEAQEIKKASKENPYWLSSILIGLIICELMLAVWLLL